MQMLIGALLALLVAACWLGAAGLLRLKTPLDRLHCVSFVNAVAAPLLVAAGFLAEGITGRSLKILIVAAAVMLNGAALAHATGRALQLRARDR